MGEISEAGGLGAFLRQQMQGSSGSDCSTPTYTPNADEVDAWFHGKRSEDRVRSEDNQPTKKPRWGNYSDFVRECLTLTTDRSGKVVYGTRNTTCYSYDPTIKEFNDWFEQKVEKGKSKARNLGRRVLNYTLGEESERNMEYHEFAATSPTGQTKKFGILGENHIYTQQESYFARQVVQGYDTIAREGKSKITLFEALAGVLLLPQYAAVIAATKRSLKYPNVGTLAKEYQKNLVRLENDEGKSWPLKDKIRLILGALATIPLTPFIYFYLRKHPEELKFTPRKDKKNENREQVMADGSLEELQKPENNDLLVNTGLNHAPGILDRMKQKLSSLGWTLEERTAYAL